MYRTVDLGRWRADGSIEYLGRNDHPVKIRLFRIKQGQIEAQLVREAEVKEAVAIAREDVPGEKRLVVHHQPWDRFSGQLVSRSSTRLRSMQCSPTVSAPSIH